MKPVADCAFCNLSGVRGTIFRDELVWAFPTYIPVTSGHTLIVPVRHVAKFSDLTKEEKEAIFALAEKIKAALRITFGAEGFHEAWNEGEAAGQAVPHFHLHIVPRKPDDAGITEYEPRKFLYRPGSREKTPESELQAVAEEIRRHMDE